MREKRYNKEKIRRDIEIYGSSISYDLRDRVIKLIEKGKTMAKSKQSYKIVHTVTMAQTL
ncbi:hypothetical protein OTSSIDO_0481 [Orientia tsutsugamushi str. Sido]|nr:hypothetical protein OTSSIDO_0481 [Orientia tsutsugamushi str. Sido]